MTVLAYAGRYPTISSPGARGSSSTAAADVKRPGWFGKVEMGVMHVAARPSDPGGDLRDQPAPALSQLRRRRPTRGTSGWSGRRSRDEDPRHGQLLLGAGGVGRERVDGDARPPPVTVMVGTKDRLTPPHYARPPRGHRGLATDRGARQGTHARVRSDRRGVRCRGRPRPGGPGPVAGPSARPESPAASGVSWSGPGGAPSPPGADPADGVVAVSTGAVRAIV